MTEAVIVIAIISSAAFVTLLGDSIRILLTHKAVAQVDKNQ
jgi:serine/threonine protein phosphatase PrpC